MLSNEKKIFRTFQDYYYHSTTPKGIEGICKDGYIRPNDGSFPPTFGSFNYARKHGYIALFDFVNINEKQFVRDYWKCNTYFLHHQEPRFLIGFESAKLKPKIQMYDESKGKAISPESGLFLKLYKIPDLEIWYPEPLPLCWATYIYVIPPGDKESIQIIHLRGD